MRSPRNLGILLALLCLTSLAAGVGGTTASFRGEAENPGNEISAAPDFAAPQVSLPEIGKAAGGLLGYVTAGGDYYVYANVSDSGNPASGVASVTADVSALSAGQTAVALEAGSFTVDGKSYNYRSAALSVDAALAAGSHAFSLTSRDTAGNERTQGGFSVAVDNSGPAATDVQTANGGTTVGRAEQGDTISFSYSEQIDPGSILAGWSGGERAVVVRIVNGGLTGLGNDELVVYDATNTTRLSLGVLDLRRSDYVGTVLVGGFTTFGASLSASTMVVDGSTITVTLGTPAELGVNTAAGTGTMVWAPAAGATDLAGNATSTAKATESGAADKEF